MSNPTAIFPERAHRSGSPLAPATRAGGFVFVSGCVATDYVTGSAIADGIEGQTRQVLKNLAAVLEAAGTSLRRVVKTTVFLTDVADFAAMNTIYGAVFDKFLPARSTVVVAALARPEFRVEIDAIALAGDDEGLRSAVTTDTE